MGFVRVIEDIFQQSMNDSVAKALISKTGTESIKSVLELYFKDIHQLNFGVYDEPPPIFYNDPDWMVVAFLKLFYKYHEQVGSPIK